MLEDSPISLISLTCNGRGLLRDHYYIVSKSPTDILNTITHKHLVHISKMKIKHVRQEAQQRRPVIGLPQSSQIIQNHDITSQYHKLHHH